jgi:Flp pilus assembly pilin Flp
MSLLNAAEKHLQRFAEDTTGVTIIEYALIISLISIAIGFVIPEIRSSIDILFLRTASGLGNAAAGAAAP